MIISEDKEKNSGLISLINIQRCDSNSDCFLVFMAKPVFHIKIHKLHISSLMFHHLLCRSWYKGINIYCYFIFFLLAFFYYLLNYIFQ